MSYTLGEIAGVIQAELNGDPELRISGVGTLENAGPEQLSFFSNRRYARYLRSTKAAAVVLSREDRGQCPVFSLVAKNPYLAYAKAARYLNPGPVVTPGCHSTASIDKSVSVPSTARIGANVSIGADVVLGEYVDIGPGCVIEHNAVIGNNTRLVANITVCHGVTIGERVILHPGAVIGADGFGIANDAGKWLKVPQLGSVEIHDDVEIGANTTIDRGALENTVIETGVKIDNQVQIGHNVAVGAHTAIAGCAVIAGSVTIGRHCMVGGASAITGHIEITDGVTITGFSGVSNSIRQAGIYSGAMITVDNLTWRKNMVRLRHLDELAKRVRQLEDKIDKIK